MEFRGIPFHTDHMGIKSSGIMVVDIAATEELFQASGLAVIADDFQGFPAQYPALICFQEVQVIDGKIKILVGAIVVGTKGEIANTLPLVHKQVVIISGDAHPVEIPAGIGGNIVMIQLFIGVNAPVGLLPNLKAGGGDNMGICLGGPANRNSHA